MSYSINFYNDNDEGVEVSVVDQYAAPDIADDLHSDIPETKTEENEGLETTSAAADADLEGETITQWQAEGLVEAETDAAVADGKTKPHPDLTVGEEIAAEKDGVKTSVVNKYAAPNYADDLHSDIPESKKQSEEGLETTSAYADADLEADTITQWVAEGDVEAETDAAVADGKTEPHPAKTVGEILEDEE